MHFNSEMSLWTSLRLSLLLTLSALLMGCGSTDNAVWQEEEEINGRVYTFTDTAVAGSVHIVHPDGTPVPDAAAEVDSSGFFSIHSRQLPNRFLVIVREIVPKSYHQGDEPHTLTALVEDPRNGMFIQVTPLTSLVARYAVAADVALSEADDQLAHCLYLAPVYSPSHLIPGALSEELIPDFSYRNFHQAWIDSSQLLEDYLDTLVSAYMQGQRLYLGRQDLWQDGPPTFFLRWIGKKLLANVLEGAAKKAGAAGIGWISNLILGNGDMGYIKERIEHIDTELTAIRAGIGGLSEQISSGFKELKTHIELNELFNLEKGVVKYYRTLEEDIPRFKGVPALLKEFAKQITSVDAHSEIDIAVASLHQRVAGEAGGGFSESIYDIVAEWIEEQLKSDRHKWKELTGNYVRLFLWITSIQQKALILDAEFIHTTVAADPDQIKALIETSTAEYRDRISTQAERFLNRLDRLMLIGADYGGATLKTYATLPPDAAHPFYVMADSAVGDATGAEWQIVVRLILDNQVRTKYTGLDSFTGNKKAPSDYGNYFPFMKARMDTLLNKKANPLLVNQYNEQDTWEAHSSAVNKVENIACATGVANLDNCSVTAVRYIYRKISKYPAYWKLGLDVNLGPYRLDVWSMEVAHTVGKNVINQIAVNNDRGGYDTNRAIWILQTDKPEEDRNRRFASAAFLAWIPNRLVQDHPLAPPLLEVALSRDSHHRKETPAGNDTWYGLKTDRSLPGGNYVEAYDHITLQPEQVYCPRFSAWPAASATPHVLGRFTGAPSASVNYGEGTGNAIFMKGKVEDEGWMTIWFHMGKYGVQYTSSSAKDYTSLIFDPVPTFVSRFVKAAAVDKPREGVPVFLFARHDKGYLYEHDDGLFRTSGKQKIDNQRFRFVRK